VRQIFPAVGFTSDEVEGFFTGESREWRFPEFTAFTDDDVFESGECRLRIEHHPGHTPGHVWVVEEGSGAIFVGDYLLAHHPTNPGLVRSAEHASGRAPLLQQYNAGLSELGERDAPALFPGHGRAIVDYRDLVARRLRKSKRRTESVLQALRSLDAPTTPVALGRGVYRELIDRNWEVVADLVGRLDLLVAEGRADARLGEDGAWYFEAN
jgi:glyoxylase-like metal-dependent hydrolase (beta-lactamase superfamily II)